MPDEFGSLHKELHALLASRAFTYGDFVLTSGRRSDYYIDGKQVTLEGRGLYLVARIVLQRCWKLDIEAIGGLTLGADPIAAAVAGLSGATDHPLTAFIVRKEAKSHGTGRAIEGPPLQPRVRVMLVDDTLTTGGSLLAARDRVAETGAEVVEALCIVDREEGGREALEAAEIPFHSLFRRSEFPAPHAAVSPPSS